MYRNVPTTSADHYPTTTVAHVTVATYTTNVIEVRERNEDKAHNTDAILFREEISSSVPQAKRV